MYSHSEIVPAFAIRNRIVSRDYENKRPAFAGFRMTAPPGPRSPKWRQFCDRKRIGFGRPIAQQKRVGGTDGSAERAPEMTRLNNRVKLAPASNNEICKLLNSRSIEDPPMSILRDYHCAHDKGKRKIINACRDDRESTNDQEVITRRFAIRGSAFIVNVRVTSPRNAIFLFVKSSY